MKKLLLLLSAFTLLFISCEEEENTNDENNSLEGTWLYTSRTVDGEAREIEECETNDTITFNNGTFTANYGYEEYVYNDTDYNDYTIECARYSNIGTYTTSGNSLTVSYDAYDNSTVNYNITGNILTVTFEGEEDDTEYYLETGNYRIIDVTVVETYTKQ